MYPAESQDSVSVEEDRTDTGGSGQCLPWRHMDWVLTTPIHFIYSTNISHA